MELRPRTRRARRLRRDATDVERVLWRALRELELPKLGDGRRPKIRRQHPIGAYIADFAIPAYKLAIELDGGQHAENANANADAYRTEALRSRGYRVIRFWNNEVLDNPEGVLKTILSELGKAPTSP